MKWKCLDCDFVGPESEAYDHSYKMNHAILPLNVPYKEGGL